jgi:hypothetical protein
MKMKSKISNSLNLKNLINVKKIFHILILFGTFFLSTASFAQDELNNAAIQQRIESRRIAYITEKLDLSTDEAQKFWPVFNSYKNDLKKIRKDFNVTKKVEEMSDAEAESQLKAKMDFEDRKNELRKTYLSKFRQVLPAKKVALLYNLEDQFKKELIQKAKERRDRRKQRLD